MAASSGWMWIDHARAITSTTHIDNLVDAIELALTKGQPGEAYLILEDGERSMKAMQSGLAASVGVVLPDRSIPYWLADTIAAVSEGAWPETAPCSARRPRANSGIGHELAWGRDWPP
jgi:nucleoside-diphosphate-sugar epimerase